MNLTLLSRVAILWAIKENLNNSASLQELKDFLVKLPRRGIPLQLGEGMRLEDVLKVMVRNEFLREGKENFSLTDQGEGSLEKLKI